MSTEASTNDNRIGTSPSAPQAKRVRFSQPTNTSQARNHQGSTNLHLHRAPPPAAAVFNSSQDALVLLFDGLSHGIQPLLRESFPHYGDVFWMTQKQLDIRADPSATTSSSRIKFPLNFRAEVGESPSAKALVATRDDVLSQISVVLSRIAHQAFEMNVEDHKRCKTKSY